MLGTLVVIGILLVIVGSVVFAIWRMGGRAWVIVWAWAEEALRPLVFPAQVVPIPRLQRRCRGAALRSVPQTAGGRSILPESMTVLVSLDDEDRLGGLKSVFAQELTDETIEAAQRRGWSVPDHFTLRVIGDPGTSDGRPSVRHYRAAGAFEDVGRTEPIAVHTATRTRVASTRRDEPAPAHPSTTPNGQGRTRPYVHCEIIALDGDGHDVVLSERNDTVSIGRRGCTLQLRSDLVSGRHAELFFDRGAWTLLDLDSTNGTWINGKRITAASPLLHNDEVMFAAGGPRFVFSRLTKEED